MGGRARSTSATSLQRYLAREVREPAWDLIRLGMASVADTFVAPAQDLLSLGPARRA